MQNFTEYLKEFEQTIVLAGMKKGLFGKVRLIHPRPCKLAATNFGKKMGAEVDASELMVLDYYGLLKPSTGLRVAFDRFPIAVICVAFSTVHLSHIKELNEVLIFDFLTFKNEVLRARAFNDQRHRPDSPASSL